MSSTLIPIKSFLGKYYSELAYSVSQDKYNKSRIDRFFEQKFLIQNNKTQMIVDPNLSGLTAIVSGNEILISKNLYDHPNVTVSNSMENQGVTHNPKSLYNPDMFSTVAYLICQNHTMFHIVGETDEPIYIKYKSDFETFYNSVLIVNVGKNLDVEIVEEYESHCAVNSVTNYILQENSRLNLSTFYQNNFSAISFCLRNVIAQANSKYSHVLFGKGSSCVVDESKIHADTNSTIDMLGCIDPGRSEFHTIVSILPGSPTYKFSLDHRHIISQNSKTTFTPVVVGHLPPDSFSNISSLAIESIPELFKLEKINEFIMPIISQATLERTVGVERFYDNKSKFLQFQ